MNRTEQAVASAYVALGETLKTLTEENACSLECLGQINDDLDSAYKELKECKESERSALADAERLLVERDEARSERDRTRSERDEAMSELANVRKDLSAALRLTKGVEVLVRQGTSGHHCLSRNTSGLPLPPLGFNERDLKKYVFDLDFDFRVGDLVLYRGEVLPILGIEESNGFFYGTVKPTSEDRLISIQTTVQERKPVEVRDLVRVLKCDLYPDGHACTGYVESVRGDYFNVVLVKDAHCVARSVIHPKNVVAIHSSKAT